MASFPKISTIVSWIIYLIPLYIFILEPFLRQTFPDFSIFPTGNDDTLDDSEHIPSGLNLTDDSFISLEDGVPLNCPAEAAGYRVHLLSREPLVMYIENFLREEEATHLVNVSLNKYAPSIITDGVTERVDSSIRLSDRALLDRDDTVRCIEDRARAFQGWRPHLYIERMWAQRYNASGHYRHHYDWSGSWARGGDRISTFMVYLDPDCTGGGTNFPRLQMPPGKQWCRFVECDEEEADEDAATGPKQGVTFKPIKGNAIFWENLRPDGSGYPETLHAAFPVTSGTKVGLNIWSWYQPPKKGRRVWGGI